MLASIEASKHERDNHEVFTLERGEAKYILKPGPRLSNYPRATTSPVLVLSFLGNTTAGKSFLVNHLIQSDPEEDDDESKTPIGRESHNKPFDTPPKTSTPKRSFSRSNSSGTPGGYHITNQSTNL